MTRSARLFEAACCSVGLAKEEYIKVKELRPRLPSALIPGLAEILAGVVLLSLGYPYLYKGSQGI